MNELEIVRARSAAENRSRDRPWSSTFPESGLKRDYAGILEYWQMARRHKGTIIVATVVGGLLGFLLTLSAPRVYQSRLTMEIQGLNDEFLNMRNVNPTAETSGGSDVDLQTHVKILQSKLLVDRVREKLKGAEARRRSPAAGPARHVAEGAEDQSSLAGAALAAGARHRGGQRAGCAPRG